MNYSTWSVELYNCNAFVADIANFMGLKVPSSTWIYPKVFVANMRKINTGHPEAADQLISDNVKEMSNPTRDGRAMIASGAIHPDVTPPTGPASPAPNVTIALFASRTDRRVRLAVHNTRLKANDVRIQWDRRNAAGSALASIATGIRDRLLAQPEDRGERGEVARAVVRETLIAATAT
jgi:hypothetical protein